MPDSIHHVHYGHKVIEYHLTFSNRKSLRIQVLPNCDINVIAPLNSSLFDIQEKIKSKAGWILKQQNFFERYKPNTPERRFVNGETHLYLGRQYKLKIVPNTSNDVKTYRGEMIAFTDTKTPAKKVLNDWYRVKANILFSELLNKKIVLFHKYKPINPTLEVRQMKKRWGSCNKAGKIILNINLIKAHKGCIEYVIIHELCHIVYYNHTKDFYNLLSSLCPDWERWKEKLEQQLA